MKKVTKIQLKKAQLEILDDLFNTLETKRKCCFTDWRVIGKKDEQDTDWQGNLLWEDDEHTIPKYKNKYGSVEITEDEMTEEQVARVTAIDSIVTVLEKLI